MALPELPSNSRAKVARQERKQELEIATQLQQVTMSTLRNNFLESIDQTLIKMFDLQRAIFDADELARQKALADKQKSGRDTTIEGDKVPTAIEPKSGIVKNLLALGALVTALGATFAGLRGFVNPTKNAQILMKLLRAIYISPITFFRDLGIKVGQLLKIDVAFEKLKKFFLRNATLNYLFGGSRNLETGRFQRLGLVPRVINLVSTKVTDFFKNFKLPTLGGLRGRGGAFALIKGLFNRVLSPIRAIGTFISESKIFNNPLIRGGIAFFKTVFAKILWPLGILISGFEGIKQALTSDEESYFGKFVDGITTAVSDFLGAPLDLLKNGFVFLLRKALGVDLDESGNVAGGEGVAGKIIQSIIDFSFEDLIKGLLMAPFKVVKGAVKSIKALFTGEEDPLQYIRDPVLDVIRPVIQFLDTLKTYITDQLKKVPLVGELFKTDEEKLLDDINERKEALSQLQDQEANLNKGIANQAEEVKKLEEMIATGNFDKGIFGVGPGVNNEEEARENIARLKENIAFREEQKALHDANVAQQLQEIEQMEATLALRQGALEKFDAIATASGNGAAESMRAMENNIAGTQGGLMNNNVTDASVTNVSKVENNLGNAKVDPNNSREYYNYAEAGR